MEVGVENPAQDPLWDPYDDDSEIYLDATYFSFESDCANCTIDFEIVAPGGKPVVTKKGMGSRFYSYGWACKRSGQHAWTATLVTPDGHAGTVRQGKFKVPTCTQPRPRRGSRSEAAAMAADEAEYEDANGDFWFTRSSRCEPRSRLKSGRAYRWRCRVISYTGYKECTAFASIRFWERWDFGEFVRGYSSNWGKERCRYF